MLLSKPLEQINLEDLRQLIDGEVQEGKLIDNKESMYRLVTLTKEDGVEVDDADKKKLQLDEIIQSWLEPRINFTTHFIRLDSGRFVFVIRLLQSMTAPHRVTYHDFGHFFRRNSGGAFRMDTSQLRTAFTLSETIFDRIKKFRRERVEQIAADEAPMPRQSGPKLILHLIPLEAFSSRISFGVHELKAQMTELLPLGSTGCDPRINLDGFLTYSGGSRGNRISDVRAYLQIFRNGVIEAVNADVAFPPLEGGVLHWRKNFNERYLLECLPGYLRSLQNLGIAPPIWLFVSLVGMKNVVIKSDSSIGSFHFDRGTLLLPEEYIDDYEMEAWKVLKPQCDMIWNAAGWPICLCIDEAGNLKQVR